MKAAGIDDNWKARMFFGKNWQPLATRLRMFTATCLKSKYQRWNRLTCRGKERFMSMFSCLPRKRPCRLNEKQKISETHCYVQAETNSHSKEWIRSQNKCINHHKSPRAQLCKTDPMMQQLRTLPSPCIYLHSRTIICNCISRHCWGRNHVLLNFCIKRSHLFITQLCNWRWSLSRLCDALVQPRARSCSIDLAFTFANFRCLGFIAKCGPSKAMRWPDDTRLNVGFWAIRRTIFHAFQERKKAEYTKSGNGHSFHSRLVTGHSQLRLDC